MNQKMLQNVIFAGVGGQGVLLAAELLAQTALVAGFDVKKSEIHGMAQRGGSVFSHVRFGEHVSSPIIPRGAADVVVALEQLEALRYLEYLAPDGLVFYSTQKIVPLSCSTLNKPYPEDVKDVLLQNKIKATGFDVLESALKLGNERFVNVIMLGILSTHLPFSLDTWFEAFAQSVKPEYLDLNKKAFFRGRNIAPTKTI